MRRFLPIPIFLSLLVGLGLTAMSYMGWCTDSCQAVHNYRLFGLPFETIGFVYFGALLIVFGVTFVRQGWLPVLFALFAAGVGAEFVFLFVQKHVIGAWCPVCVGIAATVGIGALCTWFAYPQVQDGRQFVALGAAALIASFGISETDRQVEAAAGFEQAIAFGQLDSDLEVYLFTDWGCPACRRLEPQLEDLMQQALPKAKVTFVDLVIHPETLNYMPYNLSFMMHNKDQYFHIRDILTELAKRNKSPSEEEVERAIATIGASYRELNYADVATGMRYFEKLGRQFRIGGTPTMIIKRRSTGKMRQLSGDSQITVEGLRSALNNLE